jgi:hypothetical protein
MFFEIIGIAHGHLFSPPPHSAGIASPGLIAGFVQLSPSHIGPSWGFDTFFASQNFDEMYSPKW